MIERAVTSQQMQSAARLLPAVPALCMHTALQATSVVAAILFSELDFTLGLVALTAASFGVSFFVIGRRARDRFESLRTFSDGAGSASAGSWAREIVAAIALAMWVFLVVVPVPTINAVAVGFGAASLSVLVASLVAVVRCERRSGARLWSRAGGQVALGGPLFTAKRSRS